MWQDGITPEVSRFFGIVIRMYFDGHLPPHFHAIQAGIEAQVGIDPIAVVVVRCQFADRYWPPA